MWSLDFVIQTPLELVSIEVETSGTRVRDFLSFIEYYRP